jgi:hypothetical protein
MAALAIDLGHAYTVKRHLQASADAAALAAAQELPNTVNAETVANAYSASAGGYNEWDSMEPVTTEVSFPSPVKVRVTQRGHSPVFFGGILGLDGFDVSATAVAARKSTTVGTPIAIYVHETCGAPTGNKGLIAGGEDMRVEGGIHSNGHFEIKNPRFQSVGRATVYRPSPQGDSPNDPAHQHTETCKTIDVDSPEADASKYCTGCPTGTVSDPEDGPWRDWVTPYHTAADVTNAAPCTQTQTNHFTFTSASPDGVYCLPPDKKFTLDPQACVARLCRLTVVAGEIELSGTGRLTPYNDDVPVLLYINRTTVPNKEIILNPSSAYDWNGYIINRWGGIKVNAASVTSPLKGLLEGEWVEVNGEDFTMLGTAPDTIGGTVFTGVVLEE